MNKPRGRPWKPGQSGNPSGRPRVVHEVMELARQACPQALDALKEIVTDKKAPPAARVSAASALLDRGFGKPAQTLTSITSRLDPALLSDDELAAIAAPLKNGMRLDS